MSLKHQIRAIWLFIWGTQTCQIADLSRASHFVETLWIAFFAHLNWAFHIAFVIRPVRHNFSDKLAAFPVRCDKGGKDQKAGVHHELARFSDAPDIFFSISRAEAQISVQTTPDIVAILYITADAHLIELRFNRMGQSGFAAARKAGKPNKPTSMRVHCMTIFLRYDCLVGINVHWQPYLLVTEILSVPFWKEMDSLFLS